MVAPQPAVKRIRGVAVSRPIIVGSTATPLSAAEKLVSPPDHTHRWTVAVRSAASNPMLAAPPPVTVETSAPASGRLRHHPSVASSGVAAGSSGVSTRGRESELDFHKMIGGKDDISYFIRRVQFKLHETYAQPTRNVDKPPFQVTETGWGEFEIQIKIFFVPEANEKPITLYHHLKLHPWNAGGDAYVSKPITPDPIGVLRPPVHEPEPEAAVVEAPTQSHMVVVPVVHSWQYEEIVFPEPTEPFYEILLAHPPTPLPATSAEAFANPAVYAAYEEQKRIYAEWAKTHPHALRSRPTIKPEPLPPEGEGGAPQAQPELQGHAAESNAPESAGESTGGTVQIKQEPGAEVEPGAEAGPGVEVEPGPEVEAMEGVEDAVPVSVEDAREEGPLPSPAQGQEQEGVQSGDQDDGPPVPVHPHPLHSVSGQLIEALSQESVLGEGRRLDNARIAIVNEIEKGRQVLIEREKEIRRLKVQLAQAQ